MPDAATDELLRLAWDAIRSWRSDSAANIAAARRAIDAGAAPDDVARAMSAAAYEALFAVLFALDEGGDPNGPPGPSMWNVVNPASGSPFGGLHEELLGADPSGLEGQDLFQ